LNNAFENLLFLTSRGISLTLIYFVGMYEVLLKFIIDNCLRSKIILPYFSIKILSLIKISKEKAAIKPTIKFLKLFCPKYIKVKSFKSFCRIL